MDIIAPIQLNFEPANKAEMFGVSIDRARALNEAIKDDCEHIALNYKKLYSVEGDGIYAGKSRLHEGKAIQRFLLNATTTGEWAYIIFLSNIYFDEIREAVNVLRSISIKIKEKQ